MAHINSDALLVDFLDGSIPVTQIARRHGMTVLQLLAWERSSDVQSQLAEIYAMAQRRAEHIALAVRAAAFHCLHRIVTEAEDPRTAERAAATIARTTSRRASSTQPTAKLAAQPTTVDQPTQADAHPSPRSEFPVPALPHPESLAAAFAPTNSPTHSPTRSHAQSLLQSAGQLAGLATPRAIARRPSGQPATRAA